MEGKDELRALPELLELAGIPWPQNAEPVHIREFDGIANILAEGAIEAELKASGLDALGVLVDADDDPTHRWSQIQSRLARAVPHFPVSLEPAGVVHTPAAHPRVGVWIMPDNVRTGMLETMLLQLRATDPALQEHAVGATTHARELGAAFRDAHRDKAELHTWLAWQDPPGLQVHMAVKKKLLKPTEQATRGFIAWFKRLFEL